MGHRLVNLMSSTRRTQGGLSSGITAVAFGPRTEVATAADRLAGQPCGVSSAELGIAPAPGGAANIAGRLSGFGGVGRPSMPGGLRTDDSTDSAAV